MDFLGFFFFSKTQFPTLERKSIVFPLPQGTTHLSPQGPRERFRICPAPSNPLYITGTFRFGEFFDSPLWSPFCGLCARWPGRVVFLTPPFLSIAVESFLDSRVPTSPGRSPVFLKRVPSFPARFHVFFRVSEALRYLFALLYPAQGKG